MNNPKTPQPREPARNDSALDPRVLATSRREAMHRRARQIRKSVVMFTTALFLAAFLAVYVQLASGHDPALTANAKARRSTARLIARAASSKAAEQAAAKKAAAAAAAAAAKRSAETAAAKQAENSAEANEEASTTTNSAPSSSAPTGSETSGSETRSSEPVSPVTTKHS